MMGNLVHKTVISTPLPLYNGNSSKEAVELNELDNKKLIKTYKKNGFTVRVFKPVLSADERVKRDIQIKTEILKIAGG